MSVSGGALGVRWGCAGGAEIRGVHPALTIPLSQRMSEFGSREDVQQMIVNGLC